MSGPGEPRIPIPIARLDQAPLFEPWRGEGYRSRQILRASGQASCCNGLWHVMGESHYGETDETLPGFTSDVIERMALPGYPFFDAVLSVATDQDVGLLDRPALWGGFSYSNLVQRMLAPSERPDRIDWVDARRAFYGQLAITKPTQLLVVGKEQWDNLPNDGGIRLPPIPLWDGSAMIDDLWLYAFQIDADVHFTIATWMYHPSSRGLLDAGYTRKKVKTVDMAICNIMSSIERIDNEWFLEPWL